MDEVTRFGLCFIYDTNSGGFVCNMQHDANDVLCIMLRVLVRVLDGFGLRMRVYSVQLEIRRGKEYGKEWAAELFSLQTANSSSNKASNAERKTRLKKQSCFEFTFFLL